MLHHRKNVSFMKHVLGLVHGVCKNISPVRDRRSTPLEWLSSSRDRDLDLGSGHTEYRRASVIDLYADPLIRHWLPKRPWKHASVQRFILH